MSQLLRSIWFWTGTIFLLLLWLPILGIIRLTDRDPALRRSARSLRLLGRSFTRLYPGRIIPSGFENIEPGKAYILVANHQSLADGPLTGYIPLDMKAVFRKDFLKVPVIGWLLRMAGEIAIDRTDPRKAAKALLECGRLVRSGCSVLIFPEGTRSKDGALLPFNETPFRIAIREGVSILPVVLEGASAALPKDSLLFRSGGDIHVKVLPPVSTEGWTAARSTELRDQIWNMINDELRRLRSPLH